jgi:hypothetical protein
LHAQENCNIEVKPAKKSPFHNPTLSFINDRQLIHGLIKRGNIRVHLRLHRTIQTSLCRKVADGKSVATVLAMKRIWRAIEMENDLRFNSEVAPS